MMKQKMLVLAVAMSTLVLGGCAAPMANKTADVATIQTMDSLFRNASYNYDGVFRIHSLELPDHRMVDSIGRERLNNVAKSFSMEYKGAVNMAQNRIEMVPTFRFARPNSEAWVRLPMLAQLDTLSLWVDASAFDLAVPELGGKLLHVQAPQDKIRDWPIKQVMAELPDALRRVYEAVDKKAYTYQPLDERTKALGASYRLRLTLDEQANKKLARDMMKELVAVAKRHAGSNVKDVESIAQLMEPLLSESEKTNKTTSQTDLLVSRSGTLLAVEDSYRISMDVGEGKPVAVSMGSLIKISNHGKPVFTLVPTASNVLEFSDLKKPSWMGGRDDGDEADSEAVDADAADVAEAVEPVAAPASGKKQPVAKPKAAKKPAATVRK